MKEINKNCDAIVVSWSFDPLGDDTGTLLVGHQDEKEMQIVNAFVGDEAREILLKLTTPKGGKSHE